MIRKNNSISITELARRIATKDKTIEAQAAEIAKLRGLLERWHNESKYISDCFAGQHWDSEKLIRIKTDTNEALK